MAKLDTPIPLPTEPTDREEEPGAATLELAAAQPTDLESEPETLYSAEYLRDCADDEARQERLEELRRRIAAGAYQIDADRIAEEMLVRGDFS